MNESPNKLVGETLTFEQLTEYLPALKELLSLPPPMPKKVVEWAEDAAVLHRYGKGETVCTEGEFGSTAYYIVSGTVDIFINNPLAHLRTRPSH